MAAINIIGYANYQKLNAPANAPEIKINDVAYAALAANGSKIPIEYAYTRPVWNTANGNPSNGDTFNNEIGGSVTWDSSYSLEIKSDIFN